MDDVQRQVTEVGIHLTNRCSARCGHCFEDSSPEENGVISLELFEQFLDEFTKRWDLKGLGITGGEPMLYPDHVHAIVEMGVSRGAKPTLLTNAFWATSQSYAKEKVQGLAEAGVNLFWISTDYFHAEFVPVERVCNLIRALQEIDANYYVNLDYLFPRSEAIEGPGLPEIRNEIQRDVETLRIHQEIAALVAGKGSHGWERVLDHGRGRTALDSLGDLAQTARECIDRGLEQVEPEDSLSLKVNHRGEVSYNEGPYIEKIIGNIGDDGFPDFLDTF